MKNRYLHEIAKFGAGAVAADFIAIWWFWTNYSLAPVSFMGVAITPDILLPKLIFDAALFIILVHYGWHIGKTPVLRERTYLLVAGGVFGAVAIAHLVRVFTGADLMVFGWDFPVWLSWIGTAAAAYLSYMSFHLSARR
ncbi:MAG: hypothetical protein JWO43_661 [Candidatus Adlerbacteria bacterium]|nr:hypothetical protein [Candidatus Adlerbacteria bacterium]